MGSVYRDTSKSSIKNTSKSSTKYTSKSNTKDTSKSNTKDTSKSNIKNISSKSREISGNNYDISKLSLEELLVLREELDEELKRKIIK